MADFEVRLLRNRAETNRVDKTEYITLAGIVRGNMRDESSIVDPVIVFESLDIPNFNYVYIPIFNRYYYVTDITSVRHKLWQISLSVDVLMTYKEAILNCKGFIDRNEYVFNPYVIDKKRVIEQGHDIYTYPVSNYLFGYREGTYVLNGLLLSIENGV